MVAIHLNKWGNSQGIRLTKDILKGLNFNLDEIDKNKIKFEPKIQDGSLILKPISKNNKLDELFSGFEGEVGNHKLDISWGEPVGNEIW